ncbi:MAG: glycosyltransferase [Bryobacterales bacterium]|nr:glycosyltransferase [Bryobacterales bacterium]
MSIGGAERLTLNAALGLAARGHEPVLYTRELPEERSFDEARSGAVPIRVAPTRIPLTLAGRLKAPLTIARMVTLARRLRSERQSFDVAYLDLVPHAAPTLRASLGRPIFFYCHYPDLLLTPPRRGLYQLYRKPLDLLERRGMTAANAIAVNSEFTRRVFERTFPNLPSPAVLYPGVELTPPPEPQAENGEILLLSINRFTHAKKLPLAVHTLARLRALLPEPTFSQVRLTLAGGFLGSSEEHAVVKAIEDAARQHGVASAVSVLKSPSDDERRRLLERCRCLLYTPENEHFGLAPIEAMAACRPVVAANSGGPGETILDEQTGRLRPPDPDAFAQAIAPWALDLQQAQAMGRAGRARVENRFSNDRFSADLEAILLELAAKR